MPQPLSAAFSEGQNKPDPVRAAYEKLTARFAQLANLGGAAGILGRDAETTMPPGAAADRDAQLDALSAVMHSLSVAPEVGAWLETVAVANYAGLTPQERRNAELMRRDYLQSTVLPEKLVAEVTRVQSEGTRLHTEKDYASDWDGMKEWYRHAFDTMREVGRAKMPALGAATPYEALLDEFSPGLTDAKVEEVFSALERDLPLLIRTALAAEAAKPEPLPLNGPFPEAQQMELVRRIATAMGFDFNRGAIFPIAGHPSEGGTPDDARITIHIDENDFFDALYAGIHESGHGMYEQNTPEEWRYQPVGAPMGMSLHESQSRIMEVQACHTPEFFRFLEKEARAVFNRPDDPALAAENLERLANRAKASFIRTQADEVTYPAHVILRHKLERAVINGEMTVDALPQAWNDGMQKLLGITPPDTAKGCQQDVHWPIGLIGYFPAYTMGDMAAAQFFSAACRAHPGLKEGLATGDFSPLASWLRDNVHGKGSLLTNDELFIQATGKPLDAGDYLENLSQRYIGKPWAQVKAENAAQAQTEKPSAKKPPQPRG